MATKKTSKSGKKAAQPIKDAAQDILNDPDIKKGLDKLGKGSVKKQDTKKKKAKK